MTMHALSRRRILAGAAALGGLAGTTLSSLSAFGTTLMPTASHETKIRGETKIPFGAAVRAGALASDPTYRQAIADNCQMIVAEGEMKWADIHPVRGEYRFEKADAIAAFARQNGMTVRGHTLAWYGALPDWTNAIATPGEAERELVGHIETMVSRYRDVIPSWDVVNEPLVDDPANAGSLRPSIWTRRLGADYLLVALRATAAADPKAQLVLNEYDIEFEGSRFAAKRRALLQLLRTLRDRDVPLHAVGLQAHLFADRTIRGHRTRPRCPDHRTRRGRFHSARPDRAARRAGRQSRARLSRNGLRGGASESHRDLGTERPLHLGSDLLHPPGWNAEPSAADGRRTAAQAVVRRHRRCPATVRLMPDNPHHAQPDAFNVNAGTNER